jgi:hypothetical protein
MLKTASDAETRRPLLHQAFLGGIGLSVIAALSLVLAAYFAGTAPRLPATAAALESPTTNRVWPAQGQTSPLDVTPAAAVVRSGSVMLTHRVNRAESPPIDLADLPPSDHSSP